ncbi:MAG: TetR/AcrR family transcriptional regulator [Chloroflexi bacterium]|nr:TetR/AcrR family transcriptional regulator [Chloroflexota bacterium]
MARLLNPATHAVRRDAFMDVATRLIQAKGYEALSIQEVIDAVGASKGAFYHYFGSKADLLEAVVERMADAIQVTWDEVLEGPAASAAQQLHDLFAATAQWKNARRDLVLAVLEGWLNDSNAVVRDKLRQLVRRRMQPMLVRIIRHGIESGEFSVSDPEGTADVIVTLIIGGQEEATDLFVASQAGRATYDEVARHFEAYADALTRILGYRAGRLSLVDPPTLHLWFG